MLTPFTTPIIYLYLDSLRLWGLRLFKRPSAYLNRQRLKA